MYHRPAPTDPAFFPDLLGALRNCPPSEPRWRDLVRLLQELCAQAKHLQPNHRQQLLSKLVSLGLFEVGVLRAPVLRPPCFEGPMF